jgi:hypothetical protein
MDTAWLRTAPATSIKCCSELCPKLDSISYAPRVRVVAFNTAEGWSRNMSEDIADELMRWVRRAGLRDSAFAGRVRGTAPDAAADPASLPLRGAA